MRAKRKASSHSHSPDDTPAPGKRKRISDVLSSADRGGTSPSLAKAAHSAEGQPSTAPFNPPLKTGPGKQYVGGISDDVLHEMAVESGREGLHDPDYWGKNARDYNLENMLRTQHGVHGGLIGYDFRDQLQQVDDQIEMLAQQIGDLEDDAFDAVDAEGDLALEREGLHVQMATEGLEPPAAGRDWLLGIGLLCLFFADLGLLSLAAAVFGISDDQFLGIPFLSETAAAASGWVTALVVLAHFAAKQLKTGLHHLSTADAVAPKEQ